MTRILIDPLELGALAALCRNASYDAAGIASEARHRAETLRAPLAATDRAPDAAHLLETVAGAVEQLLAVASSLDDDALLLAAIGSRTEAADSIAEVFGGGEHALLRQLRTDPDATP